MKSASQAQLDVRRREVAEALAAEVELEFWNAGGSGSVEAAAADPVVTEVAAGSGLLGPDPVRPLPVLRPPAGGLLRASPSCAARPTRSRRCTAAAWWPPGSAGRDKLPTPWLPPGLHLTGLEGAGEVQTPLTGPGAAHLRIGDLVWFRHAKSGELFEHTRTVELLRGRRVRRPGRDLPRPRARVLSRRRRGPAAARSCRRQGRKVRMQTLPENDVAEVAAAGDLHPVADRADPLGAA